MIYVTVSEKGQITIPSSIRKAAQILPGTRVELKLRDNEIVLHPIRPFHELYGVVQRNLVGEEKDLDYEQIRELAMQRVARRSPMKTRNECFVIDASARDNTW